MASIIDIIIVSYNAKDYLIKTIESFRQNSSNYTLTIIDNNSVDGSKEWLLEQNDLTVIIKDKNIGYGSAINIAVKEYNNPYICIANCDIEVPRNWQSLIKYFNKDEKVACIGTKIIFPDGRLQNCGIVGTEKNRILRGWGEVDKGQYNNIEEVISVCGAFFIVKRNIFQILNGFDERFFFYFEETDLHIRMRRVGFKIIYYPNVAIIHHYNKSPKRDVWFNMFNKVFNEKWKLT